nr:MULTISPECIES: class D beta-lactamase [Pseudomonas]
MLRYISGISTLFLMCSAVQAGTLCTLIADAHTQEVIVKKGECSQRVTPASTFKIALSLMGYDSGFLKDATTPTLAYKTGDPDWGGAMWLRPTNPNDWIKYSVVWYSQRITHHLGEPRVSDYAQAFGFGNADISGDPGKQNGLDRAWISSSLKISPVEQVDFLTKLVNRQLPVSQHAVEMTSRITEVAQLPGGWEVHGKTGTAFPRDANGASDEAHGYGWFVGWATKGNQTLVFTRLRQDEQADPMPAGKRVRDEILAEWPEITASYSN